MRAYRMTALLVPALIGGCAPDLGTPPQPATATRFASARSLAGDARAAWPQAGWWRAMAIRSWTG